MRFHYLSLRKRLVSVYLHSRHRSSVGFSSGFVICRHLVSRGQKRGSEGHVFPAIFPTSRCLRGADLHHQAGVRYWSAAPEPS